MIQYKILTSYELFKHKNRHNNFLGTYLSISFLSSNNQMYLRNWILKFQTKKQFIVAGRSVNILYVVTYNFVPILYWYIIIIVCLFIYFCV